MTDLRQLCNAAYAAIVSGMNEKEAARFDRELLAPPKPQRADDGRPTAITDDVFTVMRFMGAPGARAAAVPGQKV